MCVKDLYFPTFISAFLPSWQQIRWSAPDSARHRVQGRRPAAQPASDPSAGVCRSFRTRHKKGKLLDFFDGQMALIANVTVSRYFKALCASRTSVKYDPVSAESVQQMWYQEPSPPAAFTVSLQPRLFSSVVWEVNSSRWATSLLSKLKLVKVERSGRRTRRCCSQHWWTWVGSQAPLQASWKLANHKRESF